MKIKVFFIVSLVVAYQILVADTTYHAFCTNATVALERDTMTSPVFLDAVQTFISGTNGPARASAKLVMAIAMYDSFKETISEENLGACMDVCTNVIALTDCPAESWQKSAASLVFATALATQSRYVESFSACTNAIESHYASPTSEDDVALWAGICGHHFLPDLSINEALDFYAALSLVFSDNTAMLHTYTNGLPYAAIEKIREAQE